MAKRTLFVNRVKLDRTCRRLDLPVYAVVGVLECLWQLTARECPAGDIGRLPAEDIAIALGWRGDEDDLLEMLLRTEWLDRRADGMLIVHDWPEHCEDSVHAYLCRNLMLFADGSEPSDARLSKAEREAIAKKKAENFVRTNDESVRTNDESVRPASAQKRTEVESVRTNGTFVAPAIASAIATAYALPQPSSGEQELKAKTRGRSARKGQEVSARSAPDVPAAPDVSHSLHPPDPPAGVALMPNGSLEDPEHEARVKRQAAEAKRRLAAGSGQ